MSIDDLLMALLVIVAALAGHFLLRMINRNKYR
jgi:hypothetical protein